MSDVTVTLEQIRAMFAEMRKHTVEVGFWIAPERIGPNGTVLLQKREWEKLIELAEQFAVPVSTESKKAGDAGNVGDRR